MEVIADGLWRIRLDWTVIWPLIKVPTCMFLIKDCEDQYILIDAGYKSMTKTLVSLLQKTLKNDAGQQLSYIAITHAHVDHVSGIPDLMQLYPNSKIAMHEREVPFLLGQEKYSNLVGDHLLFNVAKYVALEEGQGVPVSQDRMVLVKEGDYLGRHILCIETPGHTPGSMSYLHVPSGSLMVGDVVMNYGVIPWNPILSCPTCYIFPLSTSAMDQAKSSIRKLGSFEGVIKKIFPGHDQSDGIPFSSFITLQ